MIIGNDLSHKTHYEIIGVKEDADHEEIRKTYRSIILKYHPDKLQKASETFDDDHELGDRFLEVQNAWKVLDDPRSRAFYDNELRTLRQDTVIAEDVCLEDMTLEESDGDFELSYSCRCGDYYSFDSPELAEMGYSFFKNGNEIYLQTPGSISSSIVLPCGSCSLKLRVYIDANTILPSEL